MMTVSSACRGVTAATVGEAFWRRTGLALVAVCVLGVAVPATAAIAFRAAASAVAAPVNIALRGSGALGVATTGNVTPALPGGLVAGDFMICLVESIDNVAPAMPAGWTLLSTQSGANAGLLHQASLFYKFAAAGEVAPLVTHASATKIIARIIAFSGVDPATPFDVANSFTLNPAGNTTTAAAINTVTNNAMVLYTAHLGDNSANWAITAGGPLTAAFTSSDGSGGAGASLTAYYALRNAGAQGPVTMTWNSPNSNRLSTGGLLAMRPVMSLTIPVPAGTVANDVMIASVSYGPCSATSGNPCTVTMTPPAGWTLLNSVDQTTGAGTGGYGMRLYVYYRVATAAEPASYTWRMGGSVVVNRAAGGILSFSGVDTASPIVASAAQATGNSSNHTAPSINTGTVTNTMLVSTHSINSSGTWTPPAGMTERVDRASLAVPADLGLTLGMNTEPRAAAGLTGTRTAQLSSPPATDTGATHMLALRPLSLDHYYVTHSTTAVNCQPEAVTVTVHDAAHNPVTLSSPAQITLTAVRVSGPAPGNVGDWTLVTGGGTLNNGAVNDGVATYTFAAGGESTVTFALKVTSPNQVVNIAVTDGTVTDTSGTASADAGYNQNLTFVPAGFRITNGSNVATAIGTQIAGKDSDTGFGAQLLALQAIRTDTSTGACVGVFPNGTEVVIEAANQCNNPATCSARQVTLTTQASVNNTAAIANNNGPGAPATYTNTLRFRFVGANSEAPFRLNYPEAGQISLYFRYNIPLGDGSASGNYMSGSSAPFVVRPFGFYTTATGNPGANTPAGTVYTRAGVNFAGTVKAVVFAAGQDANNDGVPDNCTALSANLATLNFSNSTTVSAVAPFEPATGTLGTLSHSALTYASGVAAVSDFNYTEVGSFTIKTDSNSYLAAGVNITTTCGVVGRFIPDHFVVTGATLTNRAAAACGTPSSFTYLDEDFALAYTVTAQNAANNTTRNYTGSWARLDLTSAAALNFGAIDNGPPKTPFLTSPAATARLQVSSAAGSWGSGASGGVSSGATATVRVSSLPNTSAARTGAPDGPFTSTAVGFAPVDPDNVALLPGALNLDADNNAANERVQLGTTQLRFGRLRISNAVGDARFALPVPIEVQYWNGLGFITNSADSCTQFAASNVQELNWSSALAPNPCKTAVTITGTLVNGRPPAPGLRLAAPPQVLNGTVDLRVNLGASGGAGNACLAVGANQVPATLANRPYLRGNWGSGSYNDDPTAKAGFGVYDGTNEFIYQRENY